MKIMKIYNGFGITPTRNFTAAGIDFFIPNIDVNNKEQIDNALEAMKKSYRMFDDDIVDYFDTFKILLRNDELFESQKYNILHLYKALSSKKLYDMKNNGASEYDMMEEFVKSYLVFSDTGLAGIVCKFSDMLFINSGIKVALEAHTSLEFKNKSGKGCQGWSVKACLVDEDYSGYMHLSLQYLWWDDAKGTIFVGDKLTQGTVQHVLTDDAEEVDVIEYNKLLANSKRGANGFGSSDVKH